jgi:hypothetical protein
MLISGAVLADPPTSKTLDFASSSSAPALQLYRGDTKTLTVTLLNNNQAGSLSNSYAAIFYFYGGAVTQNMACSWLSSNVYQVVMSTNNLATAGGYVYTGGVSNVSGVTVAQRGTLTIKTNPNH